MRFTADSLRIPAKLGPSEVGSINRVLGAEAGLPNLNVESRRLARGQTFSFETGDHEAAFVVLGGVLAARSTRGDYPRIGRRPDVWSGMPYALYLPRRTEVSFQAESDVAELAFAWTKTDEDHPARLVTPDDVRIEIRGGHTNTRQINGILPPGFDCHKLVCVEVYTPGGNWSSYPPHKHDEHRVAADGSLEEADLEETYLFKMRRQGGHAVQRVYTGDGALDATVVARDGDIVLVPFGYHPVSAAYGYDCYYLNFLAGSAQSLAATDDPEHAWVKSTWTGTDARVPMVTHAMESARS